ncbi:MAG: hypothetical protein DLM58_24410 [Pseudonocardiales bacterium]|nr:MAG: hypothetical protein DLM58_24410 [Pseudonocardiales bacterium]
MSGVERGILERLLAIDFEGVDELRIQAEQVTAVELNCACGCPSITTVVGRSNSDPAKLELTKLPAELHEVSRPDDGAPRTVLCFADANGYIANLECVYYDATTSEWPSPQSCAVLLRNRDGYVVTVEMLSRHVVRPRQPGDAWVSLEFTDDTLVATTLSGFREVFSNGGDLIERRLVK